MAFYVQEQFSALCCVILRFIQGKSILAGYSHFQGDMNILIWLNILNILCFPLIYKAKFWADLHGAIFAYDYYIVFTTFAGCAIYWSSKIVYNFHDVHVTKLHWLWLWCGRVFKHVSACYIVFHVVHIFCKFVEDMI